MKRALLAASLTVLTGSIARAGDVPPVRAVTSDEAAVERWSVKNGPSVIFAPRPSGEAAIAVVFDIGTLNDAGSGVTRLTQYVMLEGDSRHPYESLRADVWAAGGSVRLETGQHRSSIVLTASADGFERLAAALLEMTLAPRPNEALLNKLKQRVSDDISLESAGTGLDAMIAQLTNFDPRYLDTELADDDLLDRARWKDVKAQIAGPMGPANATVIVTGRFDADKLRRLLKRYTGGQRESFDAPNVTVPPDLTVHSANEAYLMIYRIGVHDATEAAVARVLSPLLHQKILSRFRRAGIGYSLGANPLLRAWQQLLVLWVPAHDPSGLDLKPYINEEVSVVRNGKLRDEDLELARAQATEELRETGEDPTTLLEALMDGLDVEDWYGPRVSAAIASLTKADLTRVASEWLEDNSAFSVHFVRVDPSQYAHQRRKSGR